MTTPARTCLRSSPGQPFLPAGCRAPRRSGHGADLTGPPTGPSTTSVGTVPRVTSAQDRLDLAWSYVDAATRQLLTDDGTGILAVDRCLLVLDMLEEAGALPGKPVDPAPTAMANLARAEEHLTLIPEDERPVRLGPARAELKVTAGELSSRT